MGGGGRPSFLLLPPSHAPLFHPSLCLFLLSPRPQAAKKALNPLASAKGAKKTKKAQEEEEESEDEEKPAKRSAKKPAAEEAAPKKKARK